MVSHLLEESRHVRSPLWLLLHSHLEVMALQALVNQQPLPRGLLEIVHHQIVHGVSVDCQQRLV
jgi:hypothetical protein